MVICYQWQRSLRKDETMANKILVVDDDLNICELLKLYLENEGYTVFTANDGQEAVNTFQAKSPNLVLLDIMLPKMDGWQVCREIRKTSSAPIIMLTAKGETFDKVLGLELGADDYVVKPFDAKEVMARVKAVLRRTKGDAENQDNQKKIILRQIRTGFTPVTSFLTRFGDLITTATQEQLMFMSKDSVKNSRAFRTNGHLKPFGA